MKTYSIDTRTIKPGDIFVAIKGETRDGHDFVTEAFAKEASSAIVAQDYEGQEANLIRVPDTLKALQDLAHEHLMQMPAKRVAITGSTGKTTTRQLTEAALKACLGDNVVLTSHASFNNHLGVPLTALRVRPEHKVAVFEMGMSTFGEIKRLCKIVEPHIGLITNIGSAHSGNLGGPEGVAKAKAELFEALQPEGVGIVNIDDPRCVRESDKKLTARKMGFGAAEWADIKIIDYDKPALKYQHKRVSPELQLLGHHNIQNAAAALGIAVALGCDFQTAALGLENVTPDRGRLHVHELNNGAIVIDDTYNANPDSMEAALKVLASFDNPRHIAVLGDMGELGDSAQARHHAIGAACVQTGVDWLFACGAHAKDYGEGAFEAGLSPEKFVWATDSKALAPLVSKQLEASDAILVKGSRFMKMEEVVNHVIDIGEQQT
ncbi:MAG: UDP-N-acetylmuramoyl-tripeptide--D-alanyl-D-alanine ligase [Deltaproteobacteria bacterium]|nr:UDP-N-acetylmuramoyl-tripeptide--D-alanyl-D-alanine ligase [Deltaproteobacteria bacterium]